MAMVVVYKLKIAHLNLIDMSVVLPTWETVFPGTKVNSLGSLFFSKDFFIVHYMYSTYKIDWHV